jgi:heme exporter protein C
MKHSPNKTLEISLIGLCALLIALANYLVFMVVPNERVMGPVQRIFYFHVGSAIACYVSVGIVLVGGLFYLATRSIKADVLSQAAGEVGFLFCTIVMITGMIWGHAAWNTWFRWEPRLVTFLLLWLIFLAFNLLRTFGDPTRAATHCAVLGIVGAITVPLVVLSIKLLPELAQLHPQVVDRGGLKDTSYVQAMFLTMGALVLLQGVLIWVRARIGFLERGL